MEHVKNAVDHNLINAALTHGSVHFARMQQDDILLSRALSPLTGSACRAHIGSVASAKGNEMSAVESGMDELRTLVNKAVGRAELKARKRESLSLKTTVQILDGGGVKLTQITGIASQGIVTLTKGQAIELMERIAADVLTHQVRS